VPPAVKRTWPGDNPGTVLSVNLKAWALAKEAAARADELRIAARDLSNGTRLLDFGIDVDNSSTSTTVNPAAARTRCEVSNET